MRWLEREHDARLDAARRRDASNRETLVALAANARDAALARRLERIDDGFKCASARDDSRMGAARDDDAEARERARRARETREMMVDRARDASEVARREDVEARARAR